MAERYAGCGSSVSPPSQQRHPSNSRKPSPFRILLLDISQHLGKEDMENFKAFVEDYGDEDDKGSLTVKQLQEVTTMYTLLLAAAKVGFIRPDDLSSLVAFLDGSRHCVLVEKIKDYQKREQNLTSPTDEAGLNGHLEHVEYSLQRSSLHPSADEHPGDEHSEQSSDPSLHAEANPEQPTDDAFQLSIAPLGANRQQQKIIPYFLLAVFQLSIPIKLQEAMKGIVIGRYVDVFQCIYSHFENVVKQYSRTFLKPFTGFSDEDGITLDFGLGTVQHLPIQALKHPAFVGSDDYECILQLIMEAILIAPNPDKNLAKFLKYPNLGVPESLQLLYRSRLPSVATDEELRDELARQSRHLADWLRDEQQQTNFAASKITLYRAQVYDATAHINRHQQGADFHQHAMEERQNYEPRTDLEKAILNLESTRSAQSQGYAYVEMAINSPECPVAQREHAEMV